MYRFIFVTSGLLLFFLSSEAQLLTMPSKIESAFNKQTRSADGKPGKNYWQNHAKYDISIKVTPPNKIIAGTETITYYNNSPDKLDSLNMKLIVNVHRNSRKGKNTNPNLGLTVDRIMINGAKAFWDNGLAINTNYMLPLTKELMPHDSVKLTIDWHYELSTGPGRDGVLNPSTFFLAYFYPRVSVYDDYKGWDTQPHTGSLEFYNDFNDYTLNVTVPKNYIVWATGDLKNPNEVLKPEFANKLQTSLTSDSIINIVTQKDLDTKNITAQNEANTWTFKAKNITDVTTAISNNYVWDASSVMVDEAKKRRASVQAAYPDSSADFHQSVKNSRYALGWYSKNWPGVPYPFSKSTAVQGFADMEYPMMVNDSHETDLTFAELVQDHEQAHTYFPFYMGINESYYAFMDEGWATTLEYLIGITENGKKAADDFYKSFRVKRWINGPHAHENPIITPSPDVNFGAGNNSYGKPSLSYLALKDMLGDKLFKKALHTYMDNWNGKHPIPWDYFNSMKSGSGKNLDWFFYNWFYTPYYIDLSLDHIAKSSKKKTQLFIKNIGGFAVPFDVIATFNDGTTQYFHQTPAVWEKNQKNIIVTIKTKKQIKNLMIDGGIFMDANIKDNTLNVNQN
ncbi:M1 family metallopeptidase [Pedobacter sp. SD-b]|uniref:M1 family metallopeptidase n=1 Tax=Pedobacter segetis TaxID=2793069 RepID=A0ABS1BHG3_9SPHI|nr:M1 family metallopeptidase [Pedobacter segetis]MBK0382325.1 M1 family metallopeptidase [Pedobacter segetis]